MAGNVLKFVLEGAKKIAKPATEAFAKKAKPVLESASQTANRAKQTVEEGFRKFRGADGTGGGGGGEGSGGGGGHFIHFVHFVADKANQSWKTKKQPKALRHSSDHNTDGPSGEPTQPPIPTPLPPCDSSDENTNTDGPSGEPTQPPIPTPLPLFTVPPFKIPNLIPTPPKLDVADWLNFDATCKILTGPTTDATGDDQSEVVVKEMVNPVEEQPAQTKDSAAGDPVPADLIQKADENTPNNG